MSNFAFCLLAFAWFGAGIGIMLLIRQGFKSFKAWIEVNATSYRAHRLNKRRESLMASIKRVGGCPDWSTVCRIVKE